MKRVPKEIACIVLCWFFAGTLPSLGKEFSYPGFGYYFSKVATSGIYQKNQTERINYFTQNPGIDSLYLSDPTQEDLRAIALMPKLKALNLNFHWLNPDILQELRKCKTLEHLFICTGFDQNHPLPLKLHLENVKQIELRVIPSWILLEGEPYSSLGLSQTPTEFIDIDLVPSAPNITELFLVGSSIIHGSSLGKFTTLQSLCINSNYVSSDVFPAVGSLPNLKEIAIYSIAEVNQQQLSYLFNNPKINRISIINPSEQALKAFCAWSSPKKVTIQRAENYVQYVEEIWATKNDTINIREGKGTEGTAAAICLKASPNLECFECDNVMFADNDKLHASIWVPIIRNMNALKKVRFRSGQLRLTQGNTNWIAQLTHIDDIEFYLPPTNTGSVLKQLTGMQSITKLDLSQTDISNDSGMLPAFSNLKVLDLSYSNISPELMNNVSKLRNLTSLDLSDTNITDAETVQFKNMPGLKYINLARTNITDLTLDTIRHLSNLENIDLSSTKVTGQGLLKLSSLEKLQTATFTGCNLSPLPEQVFAKLKELHSLNLADTNLTDSDLPALLKSNVISLDLSYNWFSTSKILQLKQLARLKSLNLTGTASPSFVRAHFYPASTVWPRPKVDSELVGLESRGQADSALHTLGLLDSSKLGQDRRAGVQWSTRDWNGVIKTLQDRYPVSTRRYKQRGPVCGTGRMIQHHENLIRSYLRGTALLALGRFTESLNELNKLVSCAPDSALAHANRGLCLTKLHDYSRATADLDLAIDLDPKLALAYAYRANLSNSMGKSQESTKDMQIAIRLGYNSESVAIKP